MKANFHTHTCRCRHAKGTERDMVNQALDLGLSQLGLSDHAPFEGKDYGLRMDFSELDEYLDNIEELKDLNKGKITLFKGLEIEYLQEHASGKNYYEWLLNEKKLDYLLLGQHFFNVGNGETINTYFLTETEQAILYARSICNALDTGFFKMLAHPDLFMINNGFGWDKNCSKAAELIIESALKNNVVLEYNANGLRRGKKQYPDGERFPYPHDCFWKMAENSGIKVIVGSDCHDPAVMWDSAMEQSFENLKNLGFTPLETVF